MVNRRSVIKIGAAAVAGTLLDLPVFGRNAGASGTHIMFHRAIYDERFAESRAFAAEMQGAGVHTSAIRGDVAGLWYDDLRICLSANRAPVAGLTDCAAVFFLEELSRDVGMRVIFRADHILDQVTEQYSHVRHTAVGPASLVAVTSNLTPGPGFGRTIAQLLKQVDIGEARGTDAQKRTGPFSPEHKTALVSWLIA